MPEFLWISIILSSFFAGLLISGRVAAALMPCAFTALIVAEKEAPIRNQVILFFAILAAILICCKLIKKKFNKFSK